MAINSFSKARSSNYKWWAFVAIAVGLFAAVVDNGTTVVALPSIANHFRTDLPTTQWVVIAYALTISALILPMSRLSDIIGTKRMYVVGFLVFVIGAVLAGLAPNMLLLILVRVLMGVGAAMTQGTAMAMVVSSFPPVERGKALGLQISVVGSGAVAGPAFGGFIISALDWRWVFFITALLGALSTAMAQVILLERRREQATPRVTFDWAGAALSALVMVAFLFALSSGPRMGWGSPSIIAAMVSVVLLLWVFIRWELRTPTPMLDVKLFTQRVFTFGVSASFISFIGITSVRFLMAFYLQAVRGYSPREVGLLIVPAALAMTVTGPLGGRLSDRFGWRKFNVGGLMIAAAGLFILSTLTENSPLGLVIAGMVILSSGTGVFNPPNNSSILSTVDQSKYAVVSGLLNLVRTAGTVTGIALTTAIVTAVMASMGFLPSLAAVSDSPDAGLLAAFTSGLRIAFLVIGGLMVLGALLSLAKGGQSGGAQPQEVKPVQAHRDVAV